MILHRYLLQAIILRLLLALPALALVYLAFDLGDQGRRLAAELGWGPVLYSSALHLPLVIVQILPAALMVSGVLALGDLRRRGELEAMVAAGVGPARICAPLLSAGLLSALVALLTAEGVVPRCEKFADKVLGGSRTSALTGPLLPARWYHREGWFVRLDPQERPPHIVALKLDDSFRPQERVDGRVTSLVEGRAFGLQSWFGDPGATRYRSGPIHLPVLEDVGGLQRLSRSRAEAETFLELKRRLSKLAATGHERVPERLVLHTKVAFPLLNLVIFVWLCPFALNFRRIAPIREVLSAIGVLLGLWTMIAAGWVAARVGVLSPAAGVWLPIIMGLTLGGLLTARLAGRGGSWKGLLTGAR